MSNNQKEMVFTPEGLQKLEVRLDLLKTVKRQEVAERIKAAIAFGDISENSEYNYAKEEQAFIEGEILDIENKLRNARVLTDDEITTDFVNVGTTVRIKDLSDNIEEEYTLVSPMESDPMNSRISNESPIGGALIGAKVGQEVEVTVPDGVIRYQILDIRK